jgi:exopolysaccharide biosynthesis predicted pyruvyltransferase EpsI
MMPTLLPLDRFAPVFEPFSGRKIGLVDGEGNVGDRLLYAATRQLLRHFGLKWVTFHPFYDRREDFDLDCLLLFAGGSMGSDFMPARAIRKSALATGLPCSILPQSFITADESSLPWERVFVRERASLAHSSGGVLVPDVALGYDFPEPPPPEHGRVVCLRLNGHSAFPKKRYPKKFDPAEWCYSPEQYVDFAAQYRHIITDRLHLAIIGLGLGRRVTLLPVAYHKNRSMYETWLKDLGCEWADTPEAALQSRQRGDRSLKERR